MTVTGEDRSTSSKSCSNTTLSTTNPHRLAWGRTRERTETNRLNCCMTLKLLFKYQSTFKTVGPDTKWYPYTIKSYEVCQHRLSRASKQPPSYDLFLASSEAFAPMQLGFRSATFQRLKIRKEYCMTSAFRRGAYDVFALLGCYAALIGSQVMTFRDSLWVQSSRVKQSSLLGLNST